MPNQKSESVKTLLGNPKNAVKKLSVPIILSLMAHTLFQLIDLIWVSGLGADSISAVGFFNPFAIFAVSIVTGITVGGGTRISQKIGSGAKSEADKIILHLFLIILMISMLLIIPLLIFSRPIFLFMGAGGIIELTLSYSRIMILNFFFQFFLEGAATIFRSEGDSKRAMRIYLFSIILNAVLDPVFIYLLGLGVMGAALASLISVVITTILWSYWLFIRKETYVSFALKSFRIKNDIIKDILRLGIPVSLGQIFTALMIFVNTKIVSYIGGTDGVAVYQGGLRFWNLTLLPVQGITSALTTVIGAAWGSNDMNKVKKAFSFAFKITLMIEISLMVILLTAAPLITKIYTWSKESERLTEKFIIFFRTFATLNPAAVLLFTIESLFVGTGQGSKKFILSVLRSLVCVVPLTLTFGIILKFGLSGVWAGISIGNWIATIVAVIFAIIFFKRVKFLHEHPAT